MFAAETRGLRVTAARRRASARAGRAREPARRSRERSHRACCNACDWRSRCSRIRRWCCSTSPEVISTRAGRTMLTDWWSALRADRLVMIATNEEGSGALADRRSSSPAAVWAILRKECRSEWRTRYGLNAALLFAVTSLTSVSFAVGRLGDRPDVLSALLWVVLLFAALASLSHAFVREVEGRTMILLRLIASPTAIATGKLLFNLLFLGVIELVTVPLFLILMGAPAPAWGRSSALLTLGSLALGTGATPDVGAIIAQTRGAGRPVRRCIVSDPVAGGRGGGERDAGAVERRLGGRRAALAGGIRASPCSRPASCSTTTSGRTDDDPAGTAARVDRRVDSCGVPVGAARTACWTNDTRALLPHPVRVGHGAGARVVDGPQRAVPASRGYRARSPGRRRRRDRPPILCGGDDQRIAVGEGDVGCVLELGSTRNIDLLPAARLRAYLALRSSIDQPERRALGCRRSIPPSPSCRCRS